LIRCRPVSQTETSDVHARHSNLSLLYKNDKAGGTGITLTDDIGDLDMILNDMTTNWELMYRAAVQTSTLSILVADFFQQLDTIAQKMKQVGLRDSLFVIGNVCLLSRYGFIKEDEYNGLQLAYLDTRGIGIP
jgi:hypothetical protein